MIHPFPLRIPSTVFSAVKGLDSDGVAKVPLDFKTIKRQELRIQEQGWDGKEEQSCKVVDDGKRD